MPDGKTESGSKFLLFPAEKQEGSSKGAWGYQPGGISHTLTGSPETAEEIPGQKTGGKGGGGCMRGKKPKEREKYVIRLDDGTLVEVAREIYLEWYRSKMKERYQRERDRKYGLCSIERLCEKGYFPGQSVCNVDKTLETILHNECLDKLENALKNLSEQDIRLVRFLYFEEMTVKKAAEIFGCSRKTIQNRRRKILDKIRKMMSKTSS